MIFLLNASDSSPPTRGRPGRVFVRFLRCGFIPSHEGQTSGRGIFISARAIHPLPRGADRQKPNPFNSSCDSSPPTRGGRHRRPSALCKLRFIPSHEGRTQLRYRPLVLHPIHPLPRGADDGEILQVVKVVDSSPPTRGGHSVFMRLSADLNTSLCNLHKCHSCLIRIFNMPKIPPHFHFFSNYFFVFQPPSLETFRLRMI